MTGDTSYIALLRAVNVGGSGKLPMADLRDLAEQAGFRQVSTYIASGNLLFASEMNEKRVKKTIEDALESYAGSRIEVMVRTAAEMRKVELDNPFREVAYNRIGVIFLDHPPPKSFEEKGVKNEVLKPGKREIYVHYPDGMGRSKLKIPVARFGTTRNMNTVTKLAGLASG
ncbi:MAG: hypothetical protein QG596_170 [Actinomycetota bacterium]|jgi:uncharacterized protein (DUF1697 family)|nr:hypothetical protein [Actinomycetota bacterium]